MENTFHQKLQKEIDGYVALVYDATKKFPKDEIYGLTSQFRRASPGSQNQKSNRWRTGLRSYARRSRNRGQYLQENFRGIGIN